MLNSSNGGGLGKLAECTAFGMYIPMGIGLQCHTLECSHAILQQWLGSGRVAKSVCSVEIAHIHGHVFAMLNY